MVLLKIASRFKLLILGGLHDDGDDDNDATTAALAVLCARPLLVASDRLGVATYDIEFRSLLLLVVYLVYNL